MTARIRGTFWALLVVAIVAAGALSRALGASAGPSAGAAVAVSGFVLVLAAGLALRILVVVGRMGPPSADRPPPPGRPLIGGRSAERR